jgi:DNA helicase TIP49 (TBP-interacting protein)
MACTINYHYIFCYYIYAFICIAIVISYASRGTEDFVSPHGIPRDLLDRLLIIRTLPYTREEMKTIIEIRAKTEGLSLSAEAAELLAGVGERASLRWVMNVVGKILLLLVLLFNFSRQQK